QAEAARAQAESAERQAREASDRLAAALLGEQKAVAEKDRAAYVDALARADQEWSDNHLDRARGLLLRCPRDLRHWGWGSLGRQGRPKARLLRGHSWLVEALAFLPDGRLVSGGADGFVRLWGADGRPLRALESRLGPVRAVARNPSACLIAAACYG